MLINTNYDILLLLSTHTILVFEANSSISALDSVPYISSRIRHHKLWQHHPAHNEVLKSVHPPDQEGLTVPSA